MTLADLKTQIIRKSLSNFYIFVGNEIGIMNIYLEQMSKVLNLPIVRADSVKSIYGKCTVKSFFGDVDSMYVIRGDDDISKHEDVYTNIKKEIGKNVIVLLYEKIDSRLKFGKYFKEDTVEFEPLTTMVLSTYIKKLCPLKDKNLEKLSNIVCNSYDLSLLEIDKINRYSEIMGISVDDSLDRLISDGSIYIRQEDNVFDFVDVVMLRQSKKSFSMLNNLLRDGGNSVNILGVLYNKVKSVLLIQICENGDIERTTGLDKREIYFSKKYLNIYKDYELVYMLKLIAKTIDDIKNGVIDDMYATHTVLVKIL